MLNPKKLIYVFPLSVFPHLSLNQVAQIMTGFAYIEKFIDGIGSAETAKDVFAVLRQQTELLGFEFVTYDLIAPPKDLAPIYFTTFPPNYVTRYVTQRYARHDMLSRYTAQTIRPFAWDDLIRKITLTDAQKRVYDEGMEHGLGSGGMVPIHGPGPAKAYLSVASTVRAEEGEKLFLARMHELQIIACYAHESILLLDKEKLPCPVARLTPREVEVMTWTAIGKTCWDISRILNLSEQTVKDCVHHVCRKFDVTSKTHATTLALTYGLISL